MKKLLLVLLVLGAVAAIAYLVGTEDGRARRSELLARARKGPESDSESEAALPESGGELTGTGT